MPWPRQMSEAPPGGRSRVHPASGPRLPWRLHEPLRPAGGGVAGQQTKRGCPGAAPRPQGKEGGARQALVPAAPAGSAAVRDAPPAPRMHACERLEEPARERTASYCVPSPAARAAQPALGRQLQSRVAPATPSFARPPPAAAERGVARFVCARRGGGGPAPRRGRGARAGWGVGGGESSDRPAPSLPHPPAPAPVAWLGEGYAPRKVKTLLNAGVGGAG